MAKITKQGEGAEPAPASMPQPGVPQVSQTVLAMADGIAPPETAPPFAQGATGAQQQFPTVDAQPPFYLVCDRNRWAVVGGRLIPQLHKLVGVPGANGADRANGQVSMTLAIASAVEGGRIVIPHDVDGPGRSYLRAWQVGWQVDKRTRQPFALLSWHTRWEQLFIGSPAIVTDESGYVSWVAGLVERGVLPPAQPYVYDRLVSWYRTRIGQYQGKGNGQHPLIGKYTADLEVVQRAAGAVAPIPAQPADGAVPELA